MSTAEAATETTQQQNVACYVYGVVPADVELMPDARGLGDRDVRLIRHGDIGALVSEIDVQTAIGRPEDLAAHEGLLDATAVEAPVLPFRFGAVMADPDAVAEDLLAANHDAFAAALREIEGRVEYVVKGRYDDQAILREVLAENEEAARLRDQIRGQDEMASRDLRIRLGEIVHEAVEAKREADAAAVAETLSADSVAFSVLEPSHEYDAAHIAFLVETDRRDTFERHVDDIGRDRRERIAFRLLGPLAPYDFVVTRQ